MPPEHPRQTTGADPAELAKFDAAAHRFWDTGGEFKALHALNPVRMQFIAERVALRSARAVDIGCGGGLLAESLARAGARVTGLDLAPGMIDVARLHAAAQAITLDYRCVDAVAFAAEHPAQFDVVTCMEMLEHLPDPASIFPAFERLLKPGGSLFLSTIHRHWRAFLVAIVGAEYLTGIVPRGTHEYERLLRPSELARFAREVGLVLETGAGLEYQPLTAQGRLTADLSVNYLLHLRKPVS